MTVLQKAGVPAGLLETSEDMMEHDPQLKHRQFFREVVHPEIGKYHPKRPPYILSKTLCEVRSAPLLGEHNEYVLKDILGMSDDEFTGLVQNGAFET